MTGGGDGFSMDFGGTEHLRRTLACLSGLTRYWAVPYTEVQTNGRESAGSIMSLSFEMLNLKCAFNIQNLVNNSPMKES